MLSQSVLTLLILHEKLMFVVNNHIFSSILVEVHNLCHQYLPFLLLFHYSFSIRTANTITSAIMNIPKRRSNIYASSPLMEMTSLSYLMGRRMISSRFVIFNSRSQSNAFGRCGATSYLFL